MGKQFIVKNLVESKEIQHSYDNKNYYEAVMKCRTYLEGWLIEYIYAVLYPTKADASKKNREFVESRFNSMYMQMNWLLQQEHITKEDHKNLDNIRQFTEKVIHKGDVFKFTTIDVLDKYIHAAIHYCSKLKDLTRKKIEKATGQNIKL